MRVIAGRAKGHRLAGPPSRATRPTSDLVRGAIFSDLDSVGADRCDFVERDYRAGAAIRQNLSKTGFEGQGEVLCLPVERALARLEGPYTLVLADPPYAMEATATLGLLAERGAATGGQDNA